MKRLFYAWFNSMRGLRDAFGSEEAVRQELMLLAAGIVLTPFVAGSASHGALLIGVLLLVLTVELLNTAIEKLSDHVAPERHEAIRYVKDVGSAAVLCSILIAALVWGAALIDHIFI
ncbi:diacylglycerol kinase [Terrarubrum flagellatum]|uniref:diacylglycerol kinase n=1 Tax=Terrirubrum flagellatum TaxID=2895980 RepID=UPI0031451C1A